jgi:nicotinate-nucleotide adenylyltransferase
MSGINKNIGLFFGTFNPIHVGHLIIANFIRQEQQLDEIWFVVTPHNPHKIKSELLPDYHRLSMVKEAIENVFEFKASDIEFKLPQPNYTVQTLAYLKELNSDANFTLIMGEDNLRSFHKWKNYKTILSNHKVVVYPRIIQENETIGEKKLNFLKYPIVNEFPNSFLFSEAPVIDISSSSIRKMIHAKMDVQFFLTKEVLEYVDKMNFYR